MRDTFLGYFFIVLLGVMVALSGVIMAPCIADAQEDGEDQGEEVLPTGIPPLSDRVAVLSFPLSVQPPNRVGGLPTTRDQQLIEVKVQVEDLTDGNGAFDPNEDLLPLSSAALNSGIALFRETGQVGFNFQIGDQNSDSPINLAEAPQIEPDPVVPGKFTITFRLNSNTPQARLPFVEDKVADFHVVIQTSLGLLQGDRVEFSIPANGITIQDRLQPLPDNTLFDDRFPGDAFAGLAPVFAEPAIFEGDIIEIVSTISQTDNSNRIDIESQPKTILGIDAVGRADQGYFIREIRLNFLGINLTTVTRLIQQLTDSGFSPGTSINGGVLNPTFFYSPWFYNFPMDPETGELLQDTRTITLPSGDELEVVHPLTMPLDNFGLPRAAFQIGNDNPNGHITSYTPFGPKGAPFGDESGLVPLLVTSDAFRPVVSGPNSGVFLYRDIGGIQGQFDPAIDRVIRLNPDQVRTEPFFVDPEKITDPASPLHALARQLLPARVANSNAKDVLPFLFQDSNLGATLLGVSEQPEPPEEGFPPFGSLECFDNPDCLALDMLINIQRPFLGLTEGQVRYLANMTADNGRTNSEELYGWPLIQGFSFVLPIARDNSLDDLRIPTERTGQAAGQDFFIAVQTSSNLRSLDSFIPFIRPRDLTVGTQITSFSEGNDENVQLLDSLGSLGYGRQNTSDTVALIGRPRPRFQFTDLTIPGRGNNSSNNNIIFDRSLGSPPKAVIGIDSQDFGQNPSLTENFPPIDTTQFEEFFTESTVFGEMDIEFLPGPNSVNFSPAFLSALPVELNVSPGQFLASEHTVAIYEDDSTPPGDGIDNDGDGIVDEEFFNLQDDDGDGLIDEDLGDGTQAGSNGVFDPQDPPLPLLQDRFGSADPLQEAQYVFEPNSQEKFEDFLDFIDSAAPQGGQGLQLNDGDFLPLEPNTNAFFAHIDLRVLNFASYDTIASLLVPGPGQRQLGVTAGPPFDLPQYNQGNFLPMNAMQRSDPKTPIIDLTQIIGTEAFPYFPEDLVVTDPVSGDEIWMINYIPDSDGAAPRIQDPDGDERRTFALSMINALRFPSPSFIFLRYGRNPAVIDVIDPDVQAIDAENPQGDNITDPLLFNQFGVYLEFADGAGIQDFANTITENLNTAIEDARTAVMEFEEEVANAEAECAEDPDCMEPEFPELPEPIEFEIESPFSAFGFDDFVEGGEFNTNYMYQLQIPDANFGPLAGPDYFVVLRTSPDAQVGQSFRVRIRSGILNNIQNVTIDDQQQQVRFPERGIGFHSFVATDFQFGNERFRNVSKAQITTQEIFVRSENVAPTIEFSSPGPGRNVTNNEFNFAAAFQVTDPDNVPNVQLFLDNDKQNFDGFFISGSNLTALDTTFTFNLRDSVPDFDPTQQYFLYARVSDGVNAPVFVYADGPIVTPATVGPGGGGGGGTGSEGIVVQGQLENQVDYIKLADDGRFFSFGEAATFQQVNAATRIVDMEPTSNFSGAIVVTADGRVLASGDVRPFLGNVNSSNEVVFPRSELAFYRNSTAGGELIEEPTPGVIRFDQVRDIEVDFLNKAIYVLDGDGDMLFMGSNANRNLFPDGLGLDLYRDMELAPDGSHMFFLSGNGLFSQVGASTVEPWSDLREEDIYRDIELVLNGQAVVNVIITDYDGNLTVLGSGPASSVIAALEPPEDLTPGTIRQVKTFPGDNETVLLMEGSGKVHILSNKDLNIPPDLVEFADSPGVDDDKVVDIETTNVNLRSVVNSVRDILAGLSREDSQRVMAQVSPNYKDRSGADAQGLARSLDTLFTFFEIESFSESRSANNSFVINNQGDTILANVLTDFVFFEPTLEITIPDIEEDSPVGTREIQAVGVFPFSQNIRLRDIGDGRGWQVTLWNWRPGRSIEDNIDDDEIEVQDFLNFQRNDDMRRLAIYSPRSRGVDPSITVRMERKPNDLVQNVLLLDFDENFFNSDTAPPAIETVFYPGNVSVIQEFDRIQFRFNRRNDGGFEMVSMNLRFALLPNSETFDLDEEGDLPDPVFTELSDTTVEDPFGFNFDDRGPVPTGFETAADVVFTGDELAPTSSFGAVMMLPENTNIFDINVEDFIQNLSRGQVRANPFDPAVIQGDDVEFPGFSASAVANRAYFVILRDGQRFGFMQLSDQVDVDDEDVPITFDYRFEDSFVLPPGF